VQLKIRKKLQKHFSDEMKIHFFIEDTHLPPMISKCTNSHLITRTANEKPPDKIEEFSKCDDFSGEISSAH
jgi:hypothetical protein